MSALDNEFLDRQIAKLKELIEKHDEAILKLLASPDAYASYTIETAQTRETFTKGTLPQLRAARASLLNELAVLDARRNRTGRFYGRPGF